MTENLDAVRRNIKSGALLTQEEQLRLLDVLQTKEQRLEMQAVLNEDGGGS